MSSKTTLIEIHQAIISGDAEAFKKLYSCCFNRLKFYGKSICPKLSMASIEDEIQNLFLWMAKNNYKLQAVTNFEVYLFSSFKRNVIRRYKKELSKPVVSWQGPFPVSEPLKTISYEEEIIIKEIEKENNSLIVNVLEHIGTKQREVLFLRFHVGMSFSEIGETMQLGEQVVRNYAYRSIKKIKSVLAEDMPIPKIKDIEG